MNFVKIRRLTTSNACGGLDQLVKVYNDSSFLKDEIQLITSEVLDENKVGGRRVLLKPNWVRQNLNENDEYCLRTNESFLFAVLEVFLKLKPARILIGDSPIQSCVWSDFVDSEFLNKIRRLERTYNVPIDVMDFRRVTFEPSRNNPVSDRRPRSDYVYFDLGERSLLEPITNNESIFRVNDYDSRILADSHSVGVHKYNLTKELFEYDLVISLPKIKTHQKTGITGALKNLVGFVGDKDCLPHHRIGGTGFGGDCYPGKNILRRLAEFFMDEANKISGKKLYLLFRLLARIFWKVSLPSHLHQPGAGWYGNDTCWRMVADLNLIAMYGKSDGTIANDIQRQIFSLCDGIIAGQGNGPLSPIPLPLGVISFTNFSAMHDICMATLMGFDYLKIPMLSGALKLYESQSVDIELNNRAVDLEGLKAQSMRAVPPIGWQDIL